jgi:urease subunit beta
MKPGEYRLRGEAIEFNGARRTTEISVTNVGDRPIQVGSHFGFFEVNRALQFDRKAAFGMRLDIAAGTAVRFEPGETRPVTLVEMGGGKRVFGLNNLSDGEMEMNPKVLSRLQNWQEQAE